MTCIHYIHGAADSHEHCVKHFCIVFCLPVHPPILVTTNNTGSIHGYGVN